MKFGYDETTKKYGYYKKEADTDVFVPFSRTEIVKETFTGNSKIFVFDKPIVIMAVHRTDITAVSATFLPDYDYGWGYGVAITKLSDTEYTVTCSQSLNFNVYYIYK